MTSSDGDGALGYTPTFTSEQWASNCYHTENDPLRIKFIVFTKGSPLGRRKKGDDKNVNDLASLENGLFKKFRVNEKDIEVKKDLTVEKFNGYIKGLDTDETLKEYNCFFFIFLTFAHEKGLHFDDGFIQLSDIISSVQHSCYMVGWPKVFLVQADDLSLKVTPQGPEEKEAKKLPTDADRLVMFSTVPVFSAADMAQIAPQNSTTQTYAGYSFLVGAFLSALEENTRKEKGKRLDLLSLTIHVNSKFDALLKDIPTGSDLPLPVTTSTLRKLLYMETH